MGIERWGERSTRWAGWVLATCLVTAALGFVTLSSIPIDPHIESLLPPSTMRESALGEARARYSADAPVYFVVQSGNANLNRRLARQLLQEVRAWDEVQWAIDRRDPTFFSERRLLYLDAAVLARVAETLEERLDWERCASIPLCVNLEDAPELDLDQLQSEIESLPEVATLARLFGVESAEQLDAAQSPNQPAGTGVARVGDLCRPDGEACVIHAVLRGDPGSLDYADRVAAGAHGILESVRPADAPDDLILRIAGRYSRLAGAQSAVRSDLARTGGLAFTLVVLILLAQFRGMRALLLLLVPIAVGVGWTCLAVWALGWRLNLVSAASLVVLGGIGIDFGIHLVTHFGQERKRHDARDAVRETLRALGPSLMLATLTTGVGFGALALGRFEGFAQMGRVCALAILVTFVAYITLFGPLVVLMGGRALTRGGTLPLRPPRRRGFATAITLVGVLVGVGGLATLPRMPFEHDLGNLTPPPPEETADHVDHGPALLGTSRSPTLLLANSPEDLRHAAAGLHRLYPDGLLDGAPWLITPATFVPPDGGPRLEAIGRIRAAAESLRARSERATHETDKWMPYLQVETPIRADDLPQWVRGTFSERDGTFGTIGILYEGGSAYNAEHMERRAGRLNEWHERWPAVHFASQAALLGEVTSLLRDDAPRVALLALLGLLFGALLVTRSLRRTLTVAAPVLLSVGLCIGVMVAFDVHANLYNLIVFPLAFGVGVDGAVYIAFRVGSPTGGKLDWGALPSTGRAVLGSTLTTLAAFGSLMISENRGLASLGQLAIVALGATLIANLLWLPALLRVLARNAGNEPSEQTRPRA